jgi:hypothetical protein
MSGLTTIVDASPSFVPGVFDGQDVRLAALGNRLPGVFAPGDFAVSQRAAGANMSVDIAAGRAYVEPADIARQGVYAAWMGSTFNTSSDGGYVWAAADATNPRIDLVCIEVRDTDFGGAYTGFRFRIVDGTPNAGATHQLVTSQWPAIPAGCVPIAAIRVPAAATTLTTANISSLNAVGGGRASYVNIATAETTTSAAYTRLATPDFVAVYVPHANARIRVFSEGHWKISAASGTQGITLFLNDSQLRTRVGNNAAPLVAGYEITSLGTFTSRFASAVTSTNTATTQFYASIAGATADVTNVTSGVAVGLFGVASGPSIATLEISQLAAGWYVIEQRYKTSANTLTVSNRSMWAEVIA